MSQTTITITITVDSAGEAPSIRIGSGEATPDVTDPGVEAGILRATVKRMQGRISRMFVRDVAEAGLAGKAVTVTDDLARTYGHDSAVDIGGAIGSAAAALYKAVNQSREPLKRISTAPSVWTMTAADARIVLAALDA